MRPRLALFAQLQRNLAQQLPAEVLQGFQGAIQTLVKVGIGTNAVQVGRHLAPNAGQHAYTVEKKELTFSVLSDVGNLVSRRYGLVFVTPSSLRSSTRIGRTGSNQPSCSSSTPSGHPRT